MKPSAMKVCIHQVTLWRIFAVSRIDAGEGLGQGPAAEGPDLPGGMGHVDPEGLDDETRSR